MMKFEYTPIHVHVHVHVCGHVHLYISVTVNTSVKHNLYKVQCYYHMEQMTMCSYTETYKSLRQQMNRLESKCDSKWILLRHTLSCASYYMYFSYTLYRFRGRGWGNYREKRTLLPREHQTKWRMEKER